MVNCQQQIIRAGNEAAEQELAKHSRVQVTVILGRQALAIPKGTLTYIVQNVGKPDTEGPKQWKGKANDGDKFALHCADSISF
eukprot:scaffold6419_cov116-Cylindrotheca_fusiformis.AAC.5